MREGVRRGGRVGAGSVSEALCKVNQIQSVMVYFASLVMFLMFQLIDLPPAEGATGGNGGDEGDGRDGGDGGNLKKEHPLLMSSWER